MSRALNVGVFGVGSLGQHHARIYGELAGVNLVGVYDALPERARAIADRLGTRAFASEAALAAEIEAASLAVPTDRHGEVYELLAEHKLHVLVEKPIAVTVDEATRMVRLARDHGLVLQVGHIERFNPVMDVLEAECGSPRFIECIRSAVYPPPRPEGRPRGTEVSVVLDLMIHDIEIVLHLVRSPLETVSAFGVAVLSPEEDMADARLTFANGCVAKLSASRIAEKPARRITVFQGDACAVMDYGAQSGTWLRKDREGMRVEPADVRKGDQLTRELAAFVACVREGGDPVVSGEQGLRALELAVDVCRRLREQPS